MAFIAQHRVVVAWIAGVVTIAALFVNGLVYVVPNGAPPVAVEVPLSYAYNAQVYRAGLLSLLIAPLALAVWAVALVYRRRARLAALLALFASAVVILVCVLAYWMAIFMHPTFQLTADVEFGEHHYLLGQHYTDSDNPVEFYLAKCDLADKACVWRRYYEQFLVTTEPAVMSIDEANNRIVISMTDGPVYYFDGNQGSCVPLTMGTCYSGDN